MFPLISRWLRNRNRQIFKYWDGSRVRRADPIVLFRGLKNAEDFNLDEDLKAAAAGQEDAIERCVTATRAVFGVLAYDGKQGLTEEETQDVLVGFVLWVDALKKNSSPLPTPPESSEPHLPSSIGSAADTNPSAPSTSSLPASNPDVPAA